MFIECKNRSKIKQRSIVNKTLTFRVVRVLFVSVFLSMNLAGFSQNFKVGFELSPQLSWLSTNDATIMSRGVHTGLGMGLFGEILLKHNWAWTNQAQLTLNQGGALSYKNGGNFWVNSELKFPNLNRGAKPIPDNSLLDYKLKYWSLNTGLKKVFSDDEETKVYIVFPKFNILKLIETRGSITNEEQLTSNENIIADMNRYQLGLSAAIGFEKRIGRSSAWYGSLDYMRTLTDLTRNGGYKSKLISFGDPTDPKDDIFSQSPELSRVSMNVLSIRLGLLF
ncbi:MAG: hypothetical protein ABI844_16360 [Saprospiraceae bacterium]